LFVIAIERMRNGQKDAYEWCVEWFEKLNCHEIRERKGENKRRTPPNALRAFGSTDDNLLASSAPLICFRGGRNIKISSRSSEVPRRSTKTFFRQTVQRTDFMAYSNIPVLRTPNGHVN
jgi:hypothetical protein